ncbi:MAG: M20/M25/M40 family metallo-hydrolase [Clostridiales Family XIII bacterium]|jgi:succinyl-diaminopimelate desuccinylase|nr:M20/M25/M40 family metallo-hydrolase [Clostridiales Family XIII bacterium]
MIAELRKLVAIPSVRGEATSDFPFGADVDRAYRFMLEKAEQDGFDAVDVGGFGGHIEWRGVNVDEATGIEAAAAATLGIPVHVDVVPAGDGWDEDPFEGKYISEDGTDCQASTNAPSPTNTPSPTNRIYGRGTTDNKNAVIATYYAMKALKESGFVPAKNIRLILGLDEETGWTGMAKYLEEVDAPDFGFSPDADFPVINGEMGMIVFEIAKKLEKTSESGLILRTIEGGNAPNMVPDFARAVVKYDDGKPKVKGKGRAKAQTKAKDKTAEAYEAVKNHVRDFKQRTGYNVTAKGRGTALEIAAEGVSAHGAHPELGTNAISVLMDCLSGLSIAGESTREFIDFYLEHIGFEIDGKGLGIDSSDAPSGPLIVNVGMISGNSEAIILTVNVRNPVSKKEEDVYDALRPILDKNGLGVVKLSGMEPIFVPPDSDFIETLLKVYRDNTGDTEAQPLVIGGGTYARAIPNAVAFGPRFPGEPDIMHQKNEYVTEGSFMKSSEIFADAIFELTKPD